MIEILLRAKVKAKVEKQTRRSPSARGQMMDLVAITLSHGVRDREAELEPKKGERSGGPEEWEAEREKRANEDELID
jgi:hypothetical protein